MNFKVFRPKIRSKFIGAIILVVAVFGFLNIFFIRQSTYKALREEIDKRSLSLARSLAERSTKLLLYEDMVSLQLLLDQVKEREPEVSYAFITDKQNNVLLHTFAQEFPAELKSANTIQSPESFRFQAISDEHNRSYRDVVVPLLGGELGSLRLGISEVNLNRTVNRVVLILTSMVLAFLIIGIIGAVFFAYWITNPILKITRAFEKMTLNEQFHPVAVSTKDEIGYLADKFNEMAFRLQTAHADLQKAQKKLIQTEKLASVGAIASGLAHEINSPLAGLMNCLIRIQKNPQKEQLNRYLDLMMRATEKIETVVKRLLDFSRREDYRLRAFDVNETIDHALSLVKYQIENKKIRMEKVLDRKLRACWGDSRSIEQVVVNLLVNAADAMNSGGKLTIRTFRRNSSACIQVQDSGAGIARENMDKIFDPFFTTKEPGKGTGLGLSVSFNIIKDHGGDISVESELRKGTSFLITLPLEAGE